MSEKTFRDLVSAATEEELADIWEAAEAVQNGPDCKVDIRVVPLSGGCMPPGFDVLLSDPFGMIHRLLGRIRDAESTLAAEKARADAAEGRERVYLDALESAAEAQRQLLEMARVTGIGWAVMDATQLIRAALAEAPQSGEVPPIASESGDPGWRPCLERSPGGMFCNANRGHAGPHAAYGPHADAPLATWPTDPEVKP